VWYKARVAFWYNSAGTRPLRIVVVRDPSGRRKDDCSFSTDLNLSAKGILELFAQRWPLGVAFYNAKQFLGLEDPPNRTPKAVQRTAAGTVPAYPGDPLVYRTWLLRFPRLLLGPPVVPAETNAVVRRYAGLP